MNPQAVFCPNLECPARGQVGKGNISIHSQKEKRYDCEVCQETFAARKGAIFYRLKTEPTTVILVLTLLAYGGPVQAIVAAVRKFMSELWDKASLMWDKCKRMKSKLRYKGE